MQGRKSDQPAPENEETTMSTTTFHSVTATRGITSRELTEMALELAWGDTAVRAMACDLENLARVVEVLGGNDERSPLHLVVVTNHDATDPDVADWLDLEPVVLQIGPAAAGTTLDTVAREALIAARTPQNLTPADAA